MKTLFARLTVREQEEILERLEQVVQGLFGYQPPDTDTLFTGDQVREIETRTLNQSPGIGGTQQP